MINITHTSIILLANSLIFATPAKLEETPQTHITGSTTTQSSDAATLNELNLLCSKQLRAAGLANKQGNKTKVWGNKATEALSSFSTELKVLAKNKSIQLTGTLPAGGQRPDGRTDSSPENLKDTARLNNTAGEAGNSGLVKTTPKGINDEANTALAESLSKLNGTAFDSAYQGLLISDRPVAEKLLAKAATSSDSDISSFAKKYLSKLRSARF
ncbi:hypothetical protein OC25_02230 [Pedobacter kyungheensis]|uniref:DUF4142 domain-containing protein n=1 Tax=Pedobacter kyungheensis TaxID=1069985 RepID=A0A0C1FXL2_9SPHI|nr:hypothetical protein [Pedobacter kyungheensis]KIA96578.1 hypothetical protein OC25_02230 [Pedobacter kyungheensis]